MIPSQEFTIETPEQTQLRFPLAGIGSRFLALCVDMLIQFVAGMVLLILGMLLTAGSLTWWPGGVGWALAVMILLGFVLYFGYFAFFEAIWKGQTPGKRYAGLRVIKDTGQLITPYEAITRNLMRIADQLPGVYAAGLISMAFSSHNKRLGDYVAGTIVVHEMPLEEGAVLPSSGQVSPGPLAGVMAISADELQLIETFLERRPSLPDETRRKMAAEISYRLARKLELPTEVWRDPESFLERLAVERRRLANYDS